MLTAEHLVFGYRPDRPVLKGITIKFQKDEWTLLIGPNGSGKSTFLRLLDGFLRPQQGAVRWENRPIQDIPARTRARYLGYLPQALHSLFPYSVFEIVEMGCWARCPFPWSPLPKPERDRMESILHTLGLSDLVHRPISELSGGEQQLTFLARLWVQNPAFYLLDEPTQNLDMEHRTLLWRMLFQLKREGRGGIVVTHERHFPQGLFDRVVAFRDGTILWQGPPQEVLRPEPLEALYHTPMQVQSTPDWLIFPLLGP